MSLAAIGCVWLAFVLPLVVAAIGRHRNSTKIGALVALALVLAASWLLVILVLGDLSAHHDSASWPSPLAIAGAFLITYTVVAVAAFRRKLA